MVWIGKTRFKECFTTSSLLVKLATNRLLSLLNDFVLLALRSLRFMVTSFHAFQWLDSFHDLVMWSLGSTSREIVFSSRILTKMCIHLSGKEQGEVLTLFGCCSCLKLFPGEDESLLIPPRDTFFVLNLFFDTVAWFNLKSDGLSSLGLHEELHDASKLVLFFKK